MSSTTRQKMTKRQKRMAWTMLILGFVYAYMSNYYVIIFARIFEEVNVTLFLILYLVCITLILFHSILFFDWLWAFISNMFEVEGNFLFKRKDKGLIRYKWLIRLKNWINERDIE